MEKRRPGRPRKDPQTLPAWRFMRSAMALAEYHESRKRGMKHSSAITEAAAFVRQRCPDMPISKSEVRRSLAIFWPRDGHWVLVFNESTLSDADVEERRWIQEQIAHLDGKKGLTVPLPKAEDWPRSRDVITMSIAERPVYPRHNRKAPEK
jgi:hypothetical protein